MKKLLRRLTGDHKVLTLSILLSVGFTASFAVAEEQLYSIRVKLPLKILDSKNEKDRLEINRKALRQNESCLAGISDELKKLANEVRASQRSALPEIKIVHEAGASTDSIEIRLSSEELPRGYNGSVFWGETSRRQDCRQYLRKTVDELSAELKDAREKQLSPAIDNDTVKK